MLVAPVAGAASDAAIHLQDVAFWRTTSFQAWAAEALHIVRQLRTTYPGPGDMLLQAEAIAAFAAAGMDPDSPLQRLQPLRGAQHFA